MNGAPCRQPARTIFRKTFWTLLSVGALGAFSNVGQAGVIFFNNAPAFTSAMSLAGYPFLGREDFEGSTLTAPSNQNLSNPLTQGVPLGTYTSGLTQPMSVQSNSLGDSGTVPSPGSVLLAVPAGSRNAVSHVVVPASSVDGLDWIMLSPHIRGVGLNPIILQDGGATDVKVFNQHNQLLGTVNSAADPAGSYFVGIQTTGTDRIGRINFRGTAGSFRRSAGDNALLYFPEPGSAALLGIGALVGLFRLVVERRVRGR